MDNIAINFYCSQFELKCRYSKLTINCYFYRLNITPPASPVFGTSSQSGRRSAKRFRTEEETVGIKYSNQGYVQIKEANADGKYVKLFNSGAKVSFL